MTYYIKTDAESMEVEADSFDAAANLFTGRAGETAHNWLEEISEIEGAWAWIEDEDGNRIGGHTPESLADYLTSAKIQ